MGKREMNILKAGLFLSWLLAIQPLVAGGVPWQAWSEAVFREAKAEGKLVLLDLSAEWCAFCRRMDATTWQDPEVVRLIGENYVPVRIVDEESPVLAERYREHGRPAVVIYAADGRELLRKRGYLKPLWMQWLLQAVLQEQSVPAPAKTAGNAS